jgi:hypothetical protein
LLLQRSSFCRFVMPNNSDGSAVSAMRDS